MDEDPAEEQVLTSTIACEPCRQKKCRCNRLLPVCGSCSSDPSKCWYSQGSKRGIPAGYINSLETRLAETEAALYYALCELHGGYREHNTYAPLAEHLKQRYGHGKVDVTNDWKELPMTNRQQAQSWWMDRELFVSNSQSGHRQHGGSPRAASYPSGMPSVTAMAPAGQVALASLASWHQQSFPASDLQFPQPFQQLSSAPTAQYGQQSGLPNYPHSISPSSLADTHASHYHTHAHQSSDMGPTSRHSSASSGEQIPAGGREPTQDPSGRYY